MKGLTQRQAQVVRYIVAECTVNFMPPSIREISSHLGGISTNAVNDHLVAIERKGYINRTMGKARANTPTPKAIKWFNEQKEKQCR